MKLSMIVRTCCLAAAASLAASASAQGHGGPPGGGMGGGGFNRGGMGGEMRVPAPNVRSAGGLRLGPPGRWWDDKSVARTIGLNQMQQHRMDDIFSANRDTLQTAYKNLQHEEAQLEKTTRAREVDENQIYQQIDRVTQARGELEKATAHYQLQIRKEMTAEQTSKLDELSPQVQGTP